MKTYLVEEYNYDIDFDEDSTIVALSPKVCYLLDKAGVKYSIIEDYYDEVALSAGIDEYYRSQLQWVDSLDKFLQNSVKEIAALDLKLGTRYFYYLKTMVLDPLYIRCYTLNQLFAAIKPSSITFIAPAPGETLLDLTLQSSGSSYYAQVIPLLCKENNIPLTSVFVEQDNKAIKEIRSGRGAGELLIRCARVLYQNALVRRLYLNYKYLGRCPLLPKKNRQGLNIFMLKLAHIGMDFVIDAARRGHHVYQLSDSLILKYSPLGARKYASLGAEYRDKLAKLKSDRIWEETAIRLEEHELMKWINQKCRLDVSAIVLPRLRYFITEICPQFLAYFKVFTEFYEKAGIDCVITTHDVLPVELAALAASNCQEHIKTVHISHGDDAFDNEFWRVLELYQSDIHISSNLEAKAYFSYLRQANNFPTALYGSPHRLLDAKRIGYLRESNKNNIKRNRIIYLPNLMMWDTRRMDGINYPDTWFYEFQKSLIQYFAAKKEYTFVWKGLPLSEAIYNPISNFITDNNFSNIEIATTPFSRHLLVADRVICDYPSTGFYESVVAGVPTLCLYHRASIVRKSAIDCFGNLLKLFSDTPEAIKHIEEFLNRDPELYKISLDVEDNVVLNILEENLSC